MPFDVFEKLIRDAARKDVGITYTRFGARRGLPPDVVTVQFGDVDDGLWWNVRKGEIPADDVFDITPRAKSDYEKMQEAGLISRSKGPSRRMRYRPDTIKRLRYLGWRGVLSSMLRADIIRKTSDIEKWLGTEACEDVRRHTVVVDEAAVEKARASFDLTP